MVSERDVKQPSHVGVMFGASVYSWRRIVSNQLIRLVLTAAFLSCHHAQLRQLMRAAAVLCHFKAVFMKRWLVEQHMHACRCREGSNQVLVLEQGRLSVLTHCMYYLRCIQTPRSLYWRPWINFSPSHHVWTRHNVLWTACTQQWG